MVMVVMITLSISSLPRPAAMCTPHSPENQSAYIYVFILQTYLFYSYLYSDYIHPNVFQTVFVCLVDVDTPGNVKQLLQPGLNLLLFFTLLLLLLLLSFLFVVVVILVVVVVIVDNFLFFILIIVDIFIVLCMP